MDKSERVVATAQTWTADYLPMLREGFTLPLVVTGCSMVPFLVPARDVVYLHRLEAPARRGDVVLYQRKSGQYVLHRVYQCRDGVLEMIGDGQCQRERGVQQAQLCAIVVAVRRKGVLQSPGDFWWRFFATVWLWCYPCRRGLLAFYKKGKRIFSRH